MMSGCIVWTEEERLDGWNGRKTSISLTGAFQLEKKSTSLALNSRRSFRRNNLGLGVFDHRTSEEGHDRHPKDIPSLLDVPPGVIFQRRIPVESEGAVPASQQRVLGVEFQKAVPPRRDALRLGRDYSVMGSGDVTDGFIIISRVDASREL
jgi:hypothetical protein